MTTAATTLPAGYTVRFDGPATCDDVPAWGVYDTDGDYVDAVQDPTTYEVLVDEDLAQADVEATAAAWLAH